MVLSLLSVCCLDCENGWGTGEGWSLCSSEFSLEFLKSFVSLWIHFDSIYKAQTSAENFSFISRSTAHLRETCWWQFWESAYMKHLSWEALLLCGFFFLFVCFFFCILKGETLALGSKMISSDFSFCCQKSLWNCHSMMFQRQSGPPLPISGKHGLAQSSCKWLSRAQAPEMWQGLSSDHECLGHHAMCGWGLHAIEPA